MKIGTRRYDKSFNEQNNLETMADVHMCGKWAQEDGRMVSSSVKCCSGLLTQME
jgi:hypothetical protein